MVKLANNRTVCANIEKHAYNPRQSRTICQSRNRNREGHEMHHFISPSISAAEAFYERLKPLPTHNKTQYTLWHEASTQVYPELRPWTMLTQPQSDNREWKEWKDNIQTRQLYGKLKIHFETKIALTFELVQYLHHPGRGEVSVFFKLGQSTVAYWTLPSWLA